MKKLNTEQRKEYWEAIGREHKIGIDKKAKHKALEKAKKGKNNLFESVDKTIKRIKESGFDSRYDRD